MVFIAPHSEEEGEKALSVRGVKGSGGWARCPGCDAGRRLVDYRGLPVYAQMNVVPLAVECAACGWLRAGYTRYAI